MTENLANFTDVFGEDEICDSQQSQPMSLSPSNESCSQRNDKSMQRTRPAKGTGQYKEFRSVEEIDSKYKDVFAYPFFNLVQSKVIEDALYSDKSLVVCAPTGSGKTVIFEMAIVQLLMDMDKKNCTEDFKIIYMAPVKALCTERLTEWYSKFTRLGLLCIEVTGDTDVDFSQLQAYKIIITTPEKWDMLTRRWKDHRGLVEMIKLFLIDEVHILNDESRGPVLEAVVSRMKTIQSAAQSAHRIEKLQKQYQSSSADGCDVVPYSGHDSAPTIRFVAVSATVSNPEDVAAWLKTDDKPAVYHKFGDECRPVKLRRVVEGYPCPDGTSIFKFDIILNYKLWPIIQKYHDGKPTLIFCNTRKSVLLTAETLSREITITFSPEQKVKLTALASTIKNKKLQSLILAGVGCHHAGMLYEERTYIEYAFRNGDLPILITTTTLAMGVNLPAHLVIVKNTQQYVNGAYQEYSISTVLQMVGRAGRPQFDTDATAVIMTRQRDKARYQALAGGNEPLQSYLHKRLAENLNSETALGTVCDVAQCVQWLRSTFLYVRAARDPKRYLGLTSTAPDYLILKKIEELCVRAMNGLASAGLITMDEASCIESTEAGRLMSVFYLDLETMKLIMKIQGNESLERLLCIICESHELADMHLRTDERRTLNALNRNNAAATIRFPMKGKISTRQMKLSCLIQSVLGCLPIPDPSLNQEAMKIMRIADRVCKCLVAYVTRPEPVTLQLQYYSAVLNTIILAKCIAAHLWENSPYVSKQLKGIGPTFSALLATAGKINFMLLEESHPRDLERIMNKGPPAGNVLRKQISLIPKYQLEATPVDERTVTVKLLLLNQAHLSENMENLTAGPSHKCYIIAGDSENHILLLTTFIDKDLIGVYDGTITYEIRRKHSAEHKIFVHCISSSFAGIDARCEYTFTSLVTVSPHTVDNSSHFFESNTKKVVKKQSNILDTPKERKRKNNSDEISQSKEKKKRDNALAEKFRLLKESFGRTSTVLKKDLQKTEEMTKNVLNNFGNRDQPASQSFSKETIDTITTDENVDFSEATAEINFPDNDDDIMDDAKIDSILNEIETEITKVNTEPNRRVVNSDHKQCSENKPILLHSTSNRVNQNQKPANKTNKPRNIKSNYKFLDLLEKNMNLSDEDVPVKESGFSDAIKLHVDNFLQNSFPVTACSDLTMANLYQNSEYAEITTSKANNANEEFIDMNAGCSDVGLQGHNNLPDTFITRGYKKIDSRESNNIILECESKINEDSNDLLELPEINVAEPIHNLVLAHVSGRHTGEKPKDNEISDCLSIGDKGGLNKAFIEVPDTEKQYEALDIITNNNTEVITTYNAEHDDNERWDCFSTTDLETIHNCNASVKKITNSEQTNETKLPLILNKECATNSNNSSQEMKEESLNNTKEVSVFSFQNSKNKTVFDNNDKDVHEHQSNLLLLNIQPTSTKEDSKIYVNTVNKLGLCGKQQDEIILEPTNTLFASASMGNRQVKTHRENPFDYVNRIPSHHNIQFRSSEQQSQKIYSEATKNKNTEYENKYAFSAEKVDVHTKYTTDHKIRVIRRLKVDLDVREIVSKYDKENVCKSKSNGNEQEPITNMYSEKISKNSTASCFASNNVTENQKDTLSKVPPKIMFICDINKNTNEIDMAEHLQIKDNEKSTVKVNPKSVQTPMLEDVQQIDKNNAQSRNRTPDKETNIGNILQKYSQIIRNNKNVVVKNSPNFPASNVDIKQETFKPKRPFKITEIQNLNVPLLSFTDNVKPSPATISQGGNIQSIVTNRTETPQKVIEVQKPEMAPYQKTHTVQMLPEKPLEYLELTPCQSPEQLLNHSFDISEDDFKIDHTMLNPKTLLENMGKDDTELEIIPPPPEFCSDDITYPLEIDGSEYWKNQSYFEDLDKTFQDRHNTSVFENVLPETSNLTPSKEIETWTLDCDGDFDRSLKYTTPTQSYTVMRRKMFQNYKSQDTGGPTRQERLSQFKFNCKNKFKI